METKENEGRVICSVEVMEWIEELKSEVHKLKQDQRTIAEVLKNEINRNQKGFEKIAKIVSPFEEK